MLDDFRDEEINNSGEFLDEFRQRLNTQPLESIEERRATVGRSQQIFLSALLGIGLAGVVSWFIFSPQYNQIENTDIPIVRRPQTAVKVQPAEPGGMEILNQDKTVYDIVEKKDSTNEKVESLLPPPEQPVLPIVQAEESENSESLVDVAAEAEKILEKNEAKKEEVKEAKEEAKVEETVKEVKEIKVEEVKVEEAKVEQVKPAEVKEEVKAAPVKTKTESAGVKDIPSGVWQIQLISSPNAKAVEKAWVDLKGKYSALKGLPHEVETADLGSKGLFYRLKVGAFVDRGDADKLCNSIKNSGGTCLVKKK